MGLTLSAWFFGQPIVSGRKVFSGKNCRREFSRYRQVVFLIEVKVLPQLTDDVLVMARMVRPGKSSLYGARTRPEYLFGEPVYGFTAAVRPSEICPGKFGKWLPAYQRSSRRIAKGVWNRAFKARSQNSDVDDPEAVSADNSYVSDVPVQRNEATGMRGLCRGGAAARRCVSRTTSATERVMWLSTSSAGPNSSGVLPHATTNFCSYPRHGRVRVYLALAELTGDTAEMPVTASEGVEIGL